MPHKDRKAYLLTNKERISVVARKWREKNRDHLLAYMREYHKKNRQKHRDAERLRRLGITPERFVHVLMEQGNVCGLCGMPFSDAPSEAPRADHDHLTGEFRGVLHRHCNLGLGTFNDDIGLLIKAIAYLQKFKRGETNVQVPPSAHRI
jgi:hypothetical protein